MESTHLLRRTAALPTRPDPDGHNNNNDASTTAKRRHRRNKDDDRGDRYEPPEGSWDPDLPYGGKVALARRKARGPIWWTVVQIIGALLIICLLMFLYFNMGRAIYHLEHAYAHLGHTEAQHRMGQRYLQGLGVDKDHGEAMKWFERAADNGHPQASYNLAVGHLKGHTQLKRGHARKLLKHARKHGLQEAHYVMREICEGGSNDCD